MLFEFLGFLGKEGRLFGQLGFFACKDRFFLGKGACLGRNLLFLGGKVRLCLFQILGQFLEGQFLLVQGLGLDRRLVRPHVESRLAFGQTRIGRLEQGFPVLQARLGFGQLHL